MQALVETLRAAGQQVSTLGCFACDTGFFVGPRQDLLPGRQRPLPGAKQGIRSSSGCANNYPEFEGTWKPPFMHGHEMASCCHGRNRISRALTLLLDGKKQIAIKLLQGASFARMGGLLIRGSRLAWTSFKRAGCVILPTSRMSLP